MKIYTIDYKKHFNSEGTCYTQTIRIDKDLQKRYNSKVNKLLKKTKENVEKKCTLNNEEMKIIFHLKTLKKGINYTKLTGLYEFGKFIVKKGLYNKRMFLNRNTIIEVL